MKKILICTASMGSGHLTASQGLHDRFVQEGYEVEMVDVLEWTVFGKFSRWSFSFLGKYFPNFLESIFNASSQAFASQLTKWFFSFFFPKNKIETLFTEKISEVWTTFPFIVFAIEKRWNKIIHVQVTDYMTPHLSWIWGEKVCVHVLDEDAKQYILHYSPESKVVVESFPLPKRFIAASQFSIEAKQLIKSSKNIPVNTPIFLFFFHHVLFGNEHELIEKFLTSPEYKEYFGIIIAGNNYEVFKKLKGERIGIESWVSDIHEYYAIANAVCGKCGGAFVSEVMLFELPLCISGVFSGQEQGNKAFLEKHYSHCLIDL